MHAAPRDRQSYLDTSTVPVVCYFVHTYINRNYHTEKNTVPVWNRVISRYTYSTVICLSSVRVIFTVGTCNTDKSCELINVKVTLPDMEDVLKVTVDKSSVKGDSDPIVTYGKKQSTSVA